MNEETANRTTRARPVLPSEGDSGMYTSAIANACSGSLAKIAARRLTAGMDEILLRDRVEAKTSARSETAPSETAPSETRTSAASAGQDRTSSAPLHKQCHKQPRKQLHPAHPSSPSSDRHRNDAAVYEGEHAAATSFATSRGEDSSLMKSPCHVQREHVQREQPGFQTIRQTTSCKLGAMGDAYIRTSMREEEGSAWSGTEGGYAASTSTNGKDAPDGSCSSPSEDSFGDDDDFGSRAPARRLVSGGPIRIILREKQEQPSSSEIADFSSNASFDHDDSLSITTGSEDERVNYSTQSARNRSVSPKRPLPCGMQVAAPEKYNELDEKPATSQAALLEGKPPIMACGSDVMANILSFLEPTTVLDTLTMPLSKDWLINYTRQPELWRVLCLLDPFKAKADEGNAYDSSDDDDDGDSLPFQWNHMKTFGKFRLKYTSFVRCMRYLARMKDDAAKGRPLSTKVVEHNISANQNLAQFLSRARSVVAPVEGPVHMSDDERNMAAAYANPSIAVLARHKDKKRKPPASRATKKKVKYGHSKLTQRLLGPTANGEVGDVELPWSCGIYSIVNWMVAFSDVEGIQTMCLNVLSHLLENEQQRITAQRAGLTDIVLRGMVMFPDSAPLHTAAFHTIVLLARPLGGSEGMLFHTSMVNSSGIFSSGTAGGKSGIAVLLDSMRRFQSDEMLQSMSCWSLVNIALAPAQKEVLVKLGGIAVTTKAMMEHPFNAEVQFRALFALINLVIPSVSLNPSVEQNLSSDNADERESTEKEMLDEIVDQVLNLVIISMKNFCSNEAILNRACLVLHNLSLTPSYHEAMLWTPNCYQMLEWSLANYRTDEVLQQSAAGTLHRLQVTLSGDDALRSRFTASLQAQQQLSLENARNEATVLSEQHDQPQECNDSS